MNCDEFRRWFVVLLAGGDAANWPEKEYHLHLLRCPACQLILSANEVTEAASDVSAQSGRTMDELLLGEEVLRRVQRRIAFRRVLRRASAAVSLGVVVFLVGLFWPGGSAEQFPPPIPAEVAAVQKTPEEFARILATEDFTFHQAYTVKTTKALLFAFVRTRPDADQYEFARDVILSRFEMAFPDAPRLVISLIHEDGGSLFRVTVDRERLDRLSPESCELPGTRLCRHFRILVDAEGEALPEAGKEHQE